MTGTQNDRRAELRDRIAETAARVRGLATPLTDAQLRWVPRDGGWGVGQVLEHLCLADEAYLERMRALVARADLPRALPNETWTPTLVGRLLVGALEKPRKLPAPKRWAPALAPRPRVADEYLRRADELLALMERSAAVAWRRARTSSPISPLLRLDLGDCFAILATHGRRHLGQMERVVARPDFPGA